NTLSGAITLTTGGSDYNLQSDAGSLTIQGNISTAGLTTGRNLKLSGAGNGTISGVLSDIAAAPLSLVKSGAGTWTLNSNSTLGGGITVNDSGTLAIGAGKNVSAGTAAGILSIATTSATPHISFGATPSDTGSNLTVNSITMASPDAK